MSSLEAVEKVICERYAAQGYAISRRNTKTLVVELPYGVQDFDEFVLDMRLHFGCKIDYDLTEGTGKTIEIRITPGTHAVFSDSEGETNPIDSPATFSDDESVGKPVAADAPKDPPKCSNCIVNCTVITLSMLVLTMAVIIFSSAPASHPANSEP